ncbi:hypothetical protein CI610_03047 [invertebrate metagenome]|uniref:Uncharacterized protein n=1 Tax=invertebrate metagenome TaxID=1711999 RepID=A0A2H9T490_9ZZZZ
MIYHYRATGSARIGQGQGTGNGQSGNGAFPAGYHGGLFAMKYRLLLILSCLTLLGWGAYGFNVWIQNQGWAILNDQGQWKLAYEGWSILKKYG